jgi:CheY-like chemotaxis protein
LIDDDPLVARVFGRILRRDDHDVVVGESAAAALDALAADPRFDIVLCDLNLPDLDGVELHRRIAAHWPELADRVVFLSGDIEDRRLVAAVPPERRLPKPLETDSLRAFIAAWLA